MWPAAKTTMRPSNLCLRFHQTLGADMLWYQHLTNVLKKKFNATICTEQRCVCRIQLKSAMVLHGDDVFSWWSKVYRRCFSSWIERRVQAELTSGGQNSGGTFEFRKRFHMVELQYAEITVYPEEKHIHAMIERYSLKLCKAPCNSSSTSSSLDAAMQQPLLKLWVDRRVQVNGWNCNVCESRTFWFAVCSEKPGIFLEKPKKASLGGFWQTCRAHEVQQGWMSRH